MVIYNVDLYYLNAVVKNLSMWGTFTISVFFESHEKLTMYEEFKKGR